MQDEIPCPFCSGGHIDDEGLQWLELMDIHVGLDSAVDTKSAARLLGRSVQTLMNWRALGSGPNFTKIGGRIRYHLDDIKSFREGRGGYGFEELIIGTCRKRIPKHTDDV